MVDSAPRPRKAPPSVSGPKTISNVLAEERPFLSARIGIAMIGPGGFPAAGGSSFDESQNPNHGSWCGHQHDRSLALFGNMPRQRDCDLRVNEYTAYHTTRRRLAVRDHSRTLPQGEIRRRNAIALLAKASQAIPFLHRRSLCQR